MHAGSKRDGKGVPIRASDAVQAAAKAAEAKRQNDEAEAQREYQTRGLTAEEINAGIIRDQFGMFRKRDGEFLPSQAEGRRRLRRRDHPKQQNIEGLSHDHSNTSRRRRYRARRSRHRDRCARDAGT